MRKLEICYVACVLLSGAVALGQTPKETPEESGARPDTATQASRAADELEDATSSTDRKFLQEAAEGGLAEIAAGKLAQERGASEQVKEIGNALVEDHTQANQKLMEIAEGEGIDLPNEIGRKKQKALSKLEQASGEDFDRQFLRQQEKAHRQNIARFEQAAEQSENEAIKQFAADTLPTLQKHLQLIQDASGEAAPTSSGGGSR